MTRTFGKGIERVGIDDERNGCLGDDVGDVEVAAVSEAGADGDGVGGVSEDFADVIGGENHHLGDARGGQDGCEFGRNEEGDEPRSSAHGGSSG